MSAPKKPVNTRRQEQARQNAAIYSKALRILRNRYMAEFEEIWIDLKGSPRKRPSQAKPEPYSFGENR